MSTELLSAGYIFGRWTAFDPAEVSAVLRMVHHRNNTVSGGPFPLVEGAEESWQNVHSRRATVNRYIATK